MRRCSISLAVGVACCASSWLLATSALATGDANVAACTNEALTGFEPYLADCRAYERVTPGFKDGAKAVPRALAGDGSRIVGESTGIFAGTEGDFWSTYYESVRSGSGWTTSAITPPSSDYPAQEFVDASGDSGRSLWALRHASQSVATEDLYVREPGPDGRFVEVGPMIPPWATKGPEADEYHIFAYQQYLHYSGASSDLSHLFFQTHGNGGLGNGPFWLELGDTTGHLYENTSLYEYVGTGNLQPALVGVDENGRLVSDCGTALGSIGLTPKTDNADTYNAISNDGETVFFTAVGHQNGTGCEEESLHAPEVNEVYARVGHGPQARTVAISEPSKIACEECMTGAEAPAEFQGASQDGKRAFFLTTQELFKEDTGSNLYEYDFNNRPGHKILRVSTGSKTPEVQGVVRVSEDGSHVYFVAKGFLTEGPNREGDEPVADGENLYVFERDESHPAGRVAFIATLSTEDYEDWASEDLRQAQATPDGQFLVFRSVADLTNGDRSMVGQVFEYDAASEELVRVSVGEPGYQAGIESAETHPSSITRQPYTLTNKATGATLRLALSEDGAVVVFSSAGGLTKVAKAAGESERESVYEYRSIPGAPLSDGRVYSVSNGDGGFSALSPAMDASGGDVFFETAAPVLASDVDGQVDVYDAREGGGFPPPVEPVECLASSSCQGALGPPSTPPVFGAPASGTFNGPGNLTPPPAVTPKPSTIAQKLAKALKACRSKHDRHKRLACEKQARTRLRA